MPFEFPAAPGERAKPVIHALWMSSGLSCDGESVSLTAATNPSLEDVIKGVIPGMPTVVMHHPLLAYENGADFLQAWFDADEGKLERFILLVEGSIPNENVNGEGHWAGFGVNLETGQPITTNEWVDRLAAKAEAVVAVGTCATYGGVPAMKNNPTGAMGLPDYLGWQWRSKTGVPIVCIPGCPTQPDNITEVLLYLSLMLGGVAPMIDLDEALRPRWLFQRTVHEGCNRAAFYEEGKFATSYGSEKCLIKLGCKGPVVKCNVATRGWMRGKGGCPNVGGICVGCTMPGFPDRFLPFMDTPTAVKVSLTLPRFTYGPVLRMLRKQGIKRNSKEPEWRKPSPSLTTGYKPVWEIDKGRDPLPFEKYVVGGHEARFYRLGEEHLRVELDGPTIFLDWSSKLGPSAWLEVLQGHVNPESALGLVIFGDRPEIRGDLTWRETQELVEDPPGKPAFVKVDLGTVALVWRASASGAVPLTQIQYSARHFDSALIRVLMLDSASPAVLENLGDLLSEAQLVRCWGTEISSA